MCDKTQLMVRLLQKREWCDILQLAISPQQNGFMESSQRCLDDAKTR